MARRERGTGSIFQNAAGLWVAAIPHPERGNTRRRLVKTSKHRHVVEKWLDAHVGDLIRERAILEPVLSGRDEVSLKQWLEYWLETSVVPQVRPKTAYGYRSIVESRILRTIDGDMSIGSIRAADVRRMHASMLRDGLSPTTVRNAHVVLSRALDAAVREEELQRNPCKLVEIPKRAFVPLDVPTAGEVRELLQFLPTHEHGLRWMTSILTGARRSEVAGLEVDRVSDFAEISWQLQTLKRNSRGLPIAPADFEYRHLYGSFYFTRPKSRAGWRTVPLIEPLKSLLHDHIETMEPNPWGLVFAYRGRPVSPDRETKFWAAFSKDYFGPGRHVRLHDLRHAAVDLLYNADVPEELIVEIVGHSARSMTRAYKSPAQLERLSRAMERVERSLRE